MTETLVLTTPIVDPEKVTRKFIVYSLTFSTETMATGATVPLTPVPGSLVTPPVPEPGLIVIQVKDNLGGIRTFQYLGGPAVVLITAWSHADLSHKSLNTLVLEQLSKDGHLVGTVTGE